MKKKTLSNILSWAFNGILLLGLLILSVLFFIKGDYFHGILDMLYLLIIGSNIGFRILYNNMKQKYKDMEEGSQVLIEQNAKLTEKLRSINDPFRDNRELNISMNHLRMETLSCAVEYNPEDVINCTNNERQARYIEINNTAKRKLMSDIINTALINIRHETHEDGKRYCIAEIYVGVKGDQDISTFTNL